MDILTDNLQRLARRWPRMAEVLRQVREPADQQPLEQGAEASLRVGGRLLASRYNRWEEAWLQGSLVPADSEEAWVYGVGLGDLPRRLLQRNRLQRLQVVVMQPEVFLLVLRLFDQTDWLDDPRVKLLTAAEVSAVHYPFAAVAAELLLVEDAATLPLRDRVLLELETPYLLERHSRHNREVAQRLKQNEARVRADGDVAALFDSAPGALVRVAGAGPTLAEHLPRLAREQDDVPLIAVDAALPPLLDAGVVPSVVVCIDDYREGVERWFRELPDELLRTVPLVYFPRVHPDNLDRWPGPRLAAYGTGEVYAEMARRLPRGRLFNSGSVIHPAVGLAVRMGAATVELLGADFCFPGGRHYAGNHRLQAAEGGELPHWVYSGEGERVPTLPNLRGYLRDLESYIARQPGVRFVNGSRRGARIDGAAVWEGA